MAFHCCHNYNGYFHYICSFISNCEWLLQEQVQYIYCNMFLTDWPILTSQENQLHTHLMPSLSEEISIVQSPKAQQIVGQSRTSYQAGSSLHRSLPITMNDFPEALTEELQFTVLCLNVFFHTGGNYMEIVKNIGITDITCILMLIILAD